MIPTRHLLLLLLGGAVLLGGCHGRTTRPDMSDADAKDAARDAPIETYPWPDYVTAEDRNRIEAALRTVFDVGGRDGVDAESIIVAMDRNADATEFRAVGRIVSEMKTAIDRFGVDNYEGKSRIMVLDRMLRALDGMQERLFGEEYGIDIDDSSKKVLRIVRRWNWWYRTGRFVKRYEPWDVRVDMVDPEDETEPFLPAD